MVILVKNVLTNWHCKESEITDTIREKVALTTEHYRDFLSNFDPILHVSFTCEQYFSLELQVGQNLNPI